MAKQTDNASKGATASVDSLEAAKAEMKKKSQLDGGKRESARDEYINDIRMNSEYPETIHDAGAPYVIIPSEETAKMRDEFEAKKIQLIKQWEKDNGMEWPRYENDVYDEKTGRLIRSAGSNYDAHHIHPLSLSGGNNAANITPIHASSHYDSRGIHRKGGPYRNVVKQCKEGKL